MNDLTPYSPDGGELAPLSAPDLQPADVWTVPDNPDFIGEHYHNTTSTIFGQEIPNASPQQIEQALSEICTLYVNDAVKMGIDPSFARAAVNWYRQAATAPVPREYANHHYNLRGFTFPKNDQPYVTAFCNFAAQIGASERDVRNSLWWAGELARRANQPQQPQRQGHAVTIDDLTDAEFEIVEARAERDRQNAEAILRKKWGSQYQQKMRVVWNHIANLPASHREYLETAVTQGGILLANTPECVERIYQEAINKSINPGNLAGEIASIENIMRTDRKRYNSDVVLQERLRALYQMRDGG